MNKKCADSKIPPCPGLKVTANAGISWTDSANRVHDLATSPMLTRAEAVTSALFRDLGVTTEDEVSRLISRGELYPVFRKNARFIRVFACAIPDYRARCLGARRSIKVA